MVPLTPLWAMHISDGQLSPLCCACGFVLAGLLALWGAWRIREEEIPQLAVMTAAFFLTALIHVPIPGRSSAHLLLNGLLGVVLGRRATLAVLVGLFLQSATSVMEGVGFSTLGVNTCVMAIPALFAWGLFAGLHRLPWVRHPLFRSGLVGLSSFVFVLSMCYAVTALVSNYPTGSHPLDLSFATWLTFHPLTFAGATLAAGLAAWIERRLDHAAEFPIGLLIGESAVLLSILLNGLVLIWGGTENWTGLVLLTFVIHLPLAVVEGIVLGFTVGFLARVKPQLLYGYRPAPVVASAPIRHSPSASKILTLLFAPLLLLACARLAHAHHLEAEYRVLPDHRIQIDSWFDIPLAAGEAPQGARVRVTGSDGKLLHEGLTDARGIFVFPYDKAETLLVSVNAGMGHEAKLQIPEAELTNVPATKADTLTPAEEEPIAPISKRESHFQFRDILIVLGFIFGLAAFALSIRHSYVLREMIREQQKQRDAGPPHV